MMSEPSKIDRETFDELTGKLVLLIEESGPWSDMASTHRQLSAKARHYVRYIRSSDFAKNHDKLAVRLVSIGGKLLDPDDIKTLAKMPTYDEAISQLMSVMQAPIAKLARTLNEVPGKLVRTLAAVRGAKEAA